MFNNLDFWSWMTLSCLAGIALFLGSRASQNSAPKETEWALNGSDVLDRAKAVIWVEKDDKVIWSNAVHKHESEMIGKTISAKSLNIIASDLAENNQVRRIVKDVKSEGDRHYEIFHIKENNKTTFTAICAKSAVQAENDRNRFVQTISDSFAHLKVGIAVFDKERDLSLFNPAIVETLGVSAIWLAKKPSLKDFLNRLHDKGAMPEPRDFKTWRDQIVDMEKNAINDNYQDDWHTPNNRILRVTGRSHPKGAVVFLFEDITQQTQTERSYRSELERQFQIIDKLESGIAVFDSGGILSLVNKRFDEMIQTSFSDQLVTPSVIEISEIWQDRFEPSPFGAISEISFHMSAQERRSVAKSTKNQAKYSI